MTPEERRRAADRIANAVTMALAKGVQVGVGEDCHCPLGCLPGALDPRPSPSDIAFAMRWPWRFAYGFAMGFDGDSLVSKWCGDTEYADGHHLGVLYRERALAGRWGVRS